MLFTSVRGHIMGYEFGPQNKIWSLNTSRDLYQTNIFHTLNPDAKIIKDNLINIARRYNINKKNIKMFILLQSLIILLIH